MSGLKQALVANPDEFAGTIVEKLMMYATGRNMQYYDRPAIRAILREAKPKNFTFASLVEGVVRSAPFQMRTAQGAAKR